MTDAALKQETPPAAGRWPGLAATRPADRRQTVGIVPAGISAGAPDSAPATTDFGPEAGTAPNAAGFGDALTSARLRALRDYWLELRGDRQMPSRQDIDPIDIPHLLAHLVLVDVFSDPLRFRYRLIGTEITRLVGRDATGRWLDESLYGDKVARVTDDFRACVASCTPVAQREFMLFVDKDWIRIESLALPLGVEPGRVDMVLASIDPIGTRAKNSGRDIIDRLDWRR